MGVSVKHIYQLKKQGNKTLIVTQESFDGLVTKLLTGYLSKTFQRAMDDTLVSLKQAAEQA